MTDQWGKANPYEPLTTNPNPAVAADPIRLTRLPGESPCSFTAGADGWSSCDVHGWTGPRSERSRVIVCPDASRRAATQAPAAPDRDARPAAVAADPIREALEALLGDVRPLYFDEPPERMVPTQHCVADIRRASRLLAATPAPEDSPLDGATVRRAWALSGRPDPLGDPEAWDGFALTIAAAGEHPEQVDARRLAASQRFIDTRLAATPAPEARAEQANRVLRSICICGAEPPSRPWTPGHEANPCLDGNGNFNEGHRISGELIPALEAPDRAALALPWYRETVGHASVDQIVESVARSLAKPLADGIPANTDATWIIDAKERIVAFIGNGPRQTENADAIIALASALLATPKAPTTGWHARRQEHDPFPVPTVSELDDILRKSLPSDMVYAIAPSGDPFTGWARMMLGVTPSPAANSTADVLRDLMRDTAAHLDAHGCGCVWRVGVFEKERRALAATPPATPRVEAPALDVEAVTIRRAWAESVVTLLSLATFTGPTAKQHALTIRDHIRAALAPTTPESREVGS